MLSSRVRPTWCALILCTASVLFAQSVTAKPQIKKTRIVGYGSVGFSLLADTNTPNDQDLPYSNAFAGASSKGTMRNLTRFGLNITHVANENISYVLQLAANGSDLFHGTDEGHQFKTRANLAGLKINFDLLEVLAGIVPTGYFLISDTMQMGATYLWAQPPKAFYRMGDSFNVAGGRIRKAVEFDDRLLTFEFLAGEMLYNKWFDSNSELDSRSSFLYSFGVHLETEDHAMRLAFNAVPEMNFRRFDYKVQTPVPGKPPIRVKGNGGCRSTYIGAVNMGYDGWFTDALRVQLEYALRHTHFKGCYGTQSYVEQVKWQENSGYLAFAYSMGKWTPRLLMLKQHITVDLEDAVANFLKQYPQSQWPTVEAAYRASAGSRGREKTDSYGIGLNYQLTDFIVVKSELEYYMSPDKNITGYQLPADSNATLFSAAVDYVF